MDTISYWTMEVRHASVAELFGAIDDKIEEINEAGLFGERFEVVDVDYKTFVYAEVDGYRGAVVFKTLVYDGDAIDDDGL